MRIFARLIDVIFAAFLLLGVYVFGVTLLLASLGPVGDSDVNKPLIIFSLLMMCGAPILPVVLETVTVYFWRASLGKLLLGLRIESAQFELTLTKSFVRTFLVMLLVLNPRQLGILNALPAMFSQAFAHDQISHTSVVLRGLPA